MRKIKIIIPAVLLASVVFLFCAGMAYRYNNTFSNEDFIRFHVIANSNSEEDQALKLKVRDDLVEYVNRDLRREAVHRADAKEETARLGIEETREYIEDHIEEIEAEAKKIVGEEGYDYPVEAELGVCFIPRKTYGSLTFPAGNYEALNVKIGDADGRNWWCVLYPPLCLIDAGGSESDGEDVLRDAVMQGKYSKLYEAAHGKKQTTLHLRFRTLELLGKEK